MSHKKIGLKALGLCLMAALGIMAFSVASAQATTWLEDGAAIGSTLKVESVADSSTWLLHSTALGGAVIIHCNELVVKDGLLFTNGTGLAELEFKNNCLFLFNGSHETECDPKEPIVSTVKIEAYLHENAAKEKFELFLFSPDDGTLNFVTLHLNKNGTGCSIGENITVTGHVIAKDCNKEALVDKEKHLIEPVVGTGFDLTGPPVRKNSLKFGANTASLLGSQWLTITGHTWAVHV